MIRRPPRSTRVRSSAASDVYKRQGVLLQPDVVPLLPRVPHERAGGNRSSVEVLRGLAAVVLGNDAVVRATQVGKQRGPRVLGLNNDGEIVRRRDLLDGGVDELPTTLGLARLI